MKNVRKIMREDGIIGHQTKLETPCTFETFIMILFRGFPAYTPVFTRFEEEKWNINALEAFETT